MDSQLIKFLPRGGSFYAHLFENELTGVKRGLFWCFRFDFAPIRYAGEEWMVSAAFEWLRFDKASSPLDNFVEVTDQSQPDAEGSVYLLATHNWCERWKMQLQPEPQAGKWNLSVDLDIDPDLLEEIAGTDFHIESSTQIEFEGFRVAPDNFKPSLKSEHEAASILTEYVDLGDGYSCTNDDWSYIFNRR